MHYTLKTRLLAMILAVVMAIGMPLTVFAEETGNEATGTETPIDAIPAPVNETEDMEHVHTGGAATCTELAVCDCGEAYGDFAAHIPSEDGTVCTVCEEALVKEEPTEHIHTGGAATCKELAVCVCGEAYGELAAHIPGADDSDCTTEITCTVCGEVTTEAAENHTPNEGGNACTVCGAEIAVMLIEEPEAIVYNGGLQFGMTDCDYYNIIESSKYNLAPGAMEYEYVINNDDGSRRQVVHVIEVDTSNPGVSVMPSFKNISADVDYTDTNNWGPIGVTDHAAHAEKNLGKNVVGGMNVSLSWDFNHPYGLLIYEGKVLHDSRLTCESCGSAHPGGGDLIIYRDGTAELRDPKQPLTGEEWMGMTVCFNYLVRDGVNKHVKEDHSSDPAPRSVIGIKADGTLVLMMNDGRMAPYSTGFNSHEMAEFMIALGCVDVINCDGGGSSTFITEREGSGELSVKSRFSDGSERQTLTAILVLSNVASTGEFDHAAIETDAKLVTPGTEVTFTATGVDGAGGPAELPSNVVWQLKDSTMGTVENGVFTSNGTEGTAVVQMLYNGEVVGEGSVDVVIPDAISFDYPNMTAPYGKSINLDVSAKYGNSPVTLKATDLRFVLSNESVGTIDGTTFNAAAELIENPSSAVTVTLVHNEEVTATGNISLGRGSEIVYDFESGAESVANWKLTYKEPYRPEAYFFNDTFEVVSAENGKVKNGNYALKITSDGDSITCMNWCQTRFDGLGIDLTDAVSMSFWMYIPEGSHGLEWDIGSAIPVVLGHEFKYGTGWQYFTVNVSDIGTNVTSRDRIQLYHSDTNNTADGYLHYEHPNYYADVVYYIDDITVNYSSAVDDNQAPVISNAKISYEGVDTAVTMTGQVLPTNSVAFTANAVDDATGLDTASIVVYVDGNAVNASCTDTGLISTGDITLPNGGHVVRFQISDKAGNVSTFFEHYFVLNGSSTQNTINYVPKDSTLTNVGVDSLVWMNLEATALESVNTVSTVIDLDQNSKWELDHMELAAGFTASYSIDEENNDATITITRTGDAAATGKAVLASLPIRVWSPSFSLNSEDGLSYRLVAVMSHVEEGLLTQTNGTVSYFGSVEHTTLTEYNSTRLTSVTEKHGYHTHDAKVLDKVAATCSTAGYTDRTFCEGCNSIVSWGTSIAATGVHTFDFVDGKLTCTSGGELFNGVHTDGKTYVDGVSKADGWSGESYYVDGVMVTGVYQIDGKYYNFGEDGICPHGYPMSAEWWTNETGESYYFNMGVPMTEYCMIDSVPTYFDENGAAYQGQIEIDGQICVFEKGVFVKSTTADIIAAGRIGTDAHFIFYADGTMKLIGEGETYDFVSVGDSYLPKLSWKNRPWGKNSDLSNGIKKVVVGKDLTSVGTYLFYQCYNITAVEFEADSKLVEIEEKAFHYANKLKRVILPDSVRTLGLSSFGYCANLIEVVMPEAAVNINNLAFWNNNSKLILNVAEGSPSETFAKTAGITYVTRKPVYGPADPRPTDVVVATGNCGSNVTWALYEGGKLVIGGSGAMDNYTNQNNTPWAAYRSQVNAVKIGKDVTAIGNNAFAHMYNLAYIVFEEGSVATSLGNYAFHYASKVKEVVLPDGIKTIGYSALGYCASLAKVQMPEYATSINAKAFWNDSTKLVLNVVKGSAAEAFAQKQVISYETRESAYGPGDVVPGDVIIASGTCGANATWILYDGGKLVIAGSGAIDNYTSHKNTPWADYRTQVKSVKIGKDITAVGNNAFAHLYALADIAFEEGSSLTALGNHAFHYASKVKEVVLPDGVKSIGYSALGYGASLMKVQMPENASSINANAFWNHNSKLVLNVIEGSAAETFAQKQGISYEIREPQYNPADPFPGETALASGSCGTNATWSFFESGKLVIEGSGYMDNYTSYKNTPWYVYKEQVTSVKIGKDIFTVGDNAFAHMYKLSSIEFEEGSKVSTLGSHAFHYASKVTEIILPDSVEIIGYSAMGYSANLKHVQMPANAVTINARAFWNARTDLSLSVVENSKAHAFAVANNINFTLK